MIPSTADGIFDFASNEAVSYLTTHSSSVQEAVSHITAYAFEANGSKDNMSTVVVALPAWGSFQAPAPADHVNLM